MPAFPWPNRTGGTPRRTLALTCDVTTVTALCPCTDPPRLVSGAARGLWAQRITDLLSVVSSDR